MTLDNDLDLDSGSGLDNDNDGAPDELDMGETIAEIVKERGDKLGDGSPAPVAPAPKPAAPAALAPAPAGAPAPVAPPEPVPGQRRPPDLTKAPSGWKPELSARWGEVAPELAAEIHRREEDSARGFAEIKPLVESGRKFAQAVAPFEQELRQYNIDPYQHVQTLMNAHRTLALGSPEQKQAKFAELAKAYGVTLAPAADPGESAWVDPEVKALRERTERIESERESEKREAAERHRTALASEVTAFFGDAANQYANDVAEDMAVFLRGDPKMTLAAAYQKAIWANPAVREKLVAEQNATAAKEREEREREEAEKADKARGLRPRHLQKQNGNDAEKLGSIEDTMRETFKKIEGRTKT